MRVRAIGWVGAICALLLIVSPTMANEGMWTLWEIDSLPMDSLHRAGFDLSADQIYTPGKGGLTDAIVGIGGASGSFVSPDGLVITNHHVAFGAIQRQSTTEHNYVRDGFFAHNRTEELEATGYNFYVLQSYEDITSQVLSRLSDTMTYVQRFDAIEMASKEIVRDAEKGRDVRCKFVPFYDGWRYFLFTFFEIRDVRLVFAPPDMIGSYGGEVDNWMWPRHAGDFALMRAYVGPDGSSAEYSPDNVPYHPKRFLKISGKGVEKGDFAFLIGYPGSTDRYETSYRIKQLIEKDLPRTMDIQFTLLSMLQEAGEGDSSIAVRLESSVSGISNYFKKYQGTLEGFERAHLLDVKSGQESQLLSFLKANPELDKKYGWVLPALDSVYEVSEAHEDKERVMYWMRRMVDELDFGLKINKWATEKLKPNIERQPGYLNRDTLHIKRGLREGQINLVPSVDEQMLAYFLQKALELPKRQRIAAIDAAIKIQPGDDTSDVINAFVARLYNETRLGDAEERLAMFAMSPDELKALGDPYMDFASALQKAYDKLRDSNKSVDGAISYIKPKLMELNSLWKQGVMYPDANGSIRLTYGDVQGYSPEDAVWFKWVTTLTGVIQKNTGEEPFAVPEALMKTYEARDFGTYYDSTIGDVPVDFISTCDITNGNSGSATMNGKGQLIGLAFDGNWESIPSDYVYEPKVNRAITVDIRYVLFLLDKVYHADNIMKELTIE